MIKKIAFLLALICISISELYAQTQTSFSGWEALFSSVKLNDKWSIHFDGQLRSSDMLEKAQSFLIRPGINYKVGHNMMATVGYLFVDNHLEIGEVGGWVPEHRIWEQFIINQKFRIAGRATTLQHRFRLEQRFMGTAIVEDERIKAEDYEFAQRLRYFARAIFPVLKTESFSSGPFLALQNEVFVNLHNAPNDNFFDQNRAYAALGWRVNPAFDIEAGYMNQYVLRKGTNLSNSIVQLAFYLRL